MATGWNHKYPYTNFHELNLDIWLQKMTDLETLVGTFDARITQNTNDITALKGRMTAAEADIADLKPRMSTAEGKIEDLEENVSALNDADIMDASMLSSIGTVQTTLTEVQIPFVRDTYTDGTKGSPSGSQTVTLPPATQYAAGVMRAEDKKQLLTFSLDNENHAVFSDPVAGPSPVGNNDYVTKAYVDNLAISGQAEPSKGTAIASADWQSSYLSNLTLLALTYRSYGSIRSYYLNGNVSDWSAIPYDGNLLYGDTVSAAIPAAGHMAFGCGHAVISTGSGYVAVYPLDFRITDSGRVTISTRTPGGIPAKTSGQDAMIIQLQCVFIDV